MIANKPPKPKIDLAKILAKKPPANQPRANVIPIKRSPITEVGISDAEARQLKADQKRAAFARLKDAVSTFQTLLAEGKVHATMQDGVKRWLQWEAVESAYRSLRALYVPHKQRKRVTGHDPYVDRFLAKSERFRDVYYGRPNASGKRTYEGVPDEIASVIRDYTKLQSRWHHRSASPTAKTKKKAYMKAYMAKRRAAAKKAVNG